MSKKTKAVAKKKKSVATELEFLDFFYQESNFGPADDDVRNIIKEKFIIKTGKKLPKGYYLE